MDFNNETPQAPQPTDNALTLDSFKNKNPITKPAMDPNARIGDPYLDAVRAARSKKKELGKRLALK